MRSTSVSSACRSTLASPTAQARATAHATSATCRDSHHVRGHLKKLHLKMRGVFLSPPNSHHVRRSHPKKTSSGNAWCFFAPQSATPRHAALDRAEDLRRSLRTRPLMFATGATFPNARHLVLQFAPRVGRARWEKLARLLSTKQQLARLCEMPPTRSYPHDYRIFHCAVTQESKARNRFAICSAKGVSWKRRGRFAKSSNRASAAP
jgi:hypothetical protein